MASGCKGCEERHLGCHAECENYKAWKEERDQQKDELYKQKSSEKVISNYTIENVYRAKKRTNPMKKRGTK